MRWLRKANFELRDSSDQLLLALGGRALWLRLHLPPGLRLPTDDAAFARCGTSAGVHSRSIIWARYYHSSPFYTATRRALARCHNVRLRPSRSPGTTLLPVVEFLLPALNSTFSHLYEFKNAFTNSTFLRKVTFIVPENRKQDRFSLHRTKTREQ